MPGYRFRRRNRRHEGSRTCCTDAALFARFAPPGEDLLRPNAIPAGNLGNDCARFERLRDDPCLVEHRPLTQTASTSDHLETQRLPLRVKRRSSPDTSRFSNPIKVRQPQDRDHSRKVLRKHRLRSSHAGRDSRASVDGSTCTAYTAFKLASLERPAWSQARHTIINKRELIFKQA